MDLGIWNANLINWSDGVMRFGILARPGATCLQNDVDHFLFKIEAYWMSLQKGLGQGIWIAE